MFALFFPTKQNIPSKGNKGIRWELDSYAVVFCSVCLLPCYTINSLPKFLASTRQMMFLPPWGGGGGQQEDFPNLFFGSRWGH